jgi:hypothetical protein
MVTLTSAHLTNLLNPSLVFQKIDDMGFAFFDDTDLHIMVLKKGFQAVLFRGPIGSNLLLWMLLLVLLH